jgi:phytoene synthase
VAADEDGRVVSAIISPGISRSYTYCERLARREAGNFYSAFRVLPAAKRQAMCALYAFMRLADDLSDGPADVATKRTALAKWREASHKALAGEYGHPLHPAFHHTVETYGIPCEYLEAVLDGVEMDLEPVAYATFAALKVYCYRVASAVGLACIHIWGFTDPRARHHAESAGLAFQLTNILRDLGEDAERGRVYLPREDLERFGYEAEALRRGERDEHFRALMHFEVERAKAYYEEAWPLAPLLEPAERAVFLAMTRTYRALLEAIERRDYDVFSRRISVNRWRKLLLALQVLPVRWGWVSGA